MPERRKIGETTLPNGMKVNYYCTVGGPSVKEVMEKVYMIAAKALMSKMA